MDPEKLNQYDEEAERLKNVSEYKRKFLNKKCGGNRR